MTEAIINEFQPDYVSLPGDTLSEILEERGMSQTTLAERTGRSKKTINEIIKGKAPITHETALHLERVLGLPATFWITRENQYREGLARLKERERLKEDLGFLKEVPCAALKKMGWLPEVKDKIDLLEAVLKFFGVASVRDCQNYWQGLEPAFRKSTVFEGDPVSIYAWLRMGEIEAQKIECWEYHKTKLRAAVKLIRETLIIQGDEFQHQLIDTCARAGVALVFFTSST